MSVVWVFFPCPAHCRSLEHSSTLRKRNQVVQLFFHRFPLQHLPEEKTNANCQEAFAGHSKTSQKLKLIILDPTACWMFVLIRHHAKNGPKSTSKTRDFATKGKNASEMLWFLVSEAKITLMFTERSFLFSRFQNDRNAASTTLQLKQWKSMWQDDCGLWYAWWIHFGPLLWGPTLGHFKLSGAYVAPRLGFIQMI